MLKFSLLKNKGSLTAARLGAKPVPENPTTNMPGNSVVAFKLNFPPITLSVETSLLAIPSNKVITVLSGIFFMSPLIVKPCAVAAVNAIKAITLNRNFFMYIF